MQFSGIIFFSCNKWVWMRMQTIFLVTRFQLFYETHTLETISNLKIVSFFPTYICKSKEKHIVTHIFLKVSPIALLPFCLSLANLFILFSHLQMLYIVNKNKKKWKDQKYMENKEHPTKQCIG